MITTILNFYFFLAILICSFFLILTKNPIHSIFLLILVYANSTGMLLIMGIDFISMLLLIVYMGAISVLFLFVIMMLNIQLLELNKPFWKYSIVSFYLIIVIIIQFLLFFLPEVVFVNSFQNGINYFTLFITTLDNFYYLNWASFYFLLIDLKVLGLLLYTYYSFTFIIIGLILLLAMVATIILTLNPILYSKKQLLYRQVSRKLHHSITKIK